MNLVESHTINLFTLKKQSNHPPNLIADIPEATAKSFTNISCNRNILVGMLTNIKEHEKIVALMEQ